MAAMSKDLANAEQYAHQIDKLEDEGDSLVHQLANMSDASFVTPLDKEGSARAREASMISTTSTRVPRAS